MGPENLVSSQAVVSNGVLAPDGPAYSALVLYNQTQITPDASAALIEFAQGGLPIYIVGSLPNATIGIVGQDQVSTNFEKLLEYDVVRVLSTEEFSAATLATDGVPARVRLNGDSNGSSLYTFWTSSAESSSDYVYLYNAGSDAMFNISFSASAQTEMVSLNAWTGEQTPIAVYQATDSDITTEVSLRANQTTIIALQPSSAARDAVHAVARSSNVKKIRFTDDGFLEAWVSDASDAWVILSNDTKIVLPGANVTNEAVTILGPWDLVVEAYGPSPNNDTLEGNTTTIDLGTLTDLAPWTKIDGIQNASGVGTYSTQFQWSEDSQVAVVVSFGPVLNTLRAWVNGKQIPAVDPTSPVADITNFVVDGENSIEIEVTTTLFNAVKANVDRVFSIGYGPQTPAYYTEADWQEYGLLGPVELSIMRKMIVA